MVLETIETRGGKVLEDYQFQVELKASVRKNIRSLAPAEGNKLKAADGEAGYERGVEEDALKHKEDPVAEQK